MRTFRARALRLLIALLPIMILAVSFADDYCPNC